ncbi:hypothetical protein G4167_13520 [Vibrio parahaemolyticus]|nr:hypothetical protein [Vibrio parahaemolyticus]
MARVDISAKPLLLCTGFPFSLMTQLNWEGVNDLVIMTTNQMVINQEMKMGCCNGDKKCKSEKKTKRIPWFGIVLGVLAVLVILNWQ